MTASDPLAGNPRVTFWSDPALWPDDPPGYVFLARTIQHLGQLTYGQTWLGLEPATEIITPLPESYQASMPSAELQRGCRLLFDHHENYKARCPTYAHLLEHWPMPTEQEWKEAVAISRTLAHQSQVDFGRFVEVCSRLLRAFRGGNIITATRAVGGGEMWEQSQWFWNTENFWGRFHTCRVDPLSPYQAGVVVEDGEYIFVELASFETALNPAAQQPSPEPVELSAPTELEYLSPYLRCMIAVTRGLNITADDQRKKDEIIEAIPNYWPARADELQLSDISRMATFVRDPKHKKGRGRNTGSEG